jgi:hypothetical protein
MFLLAIFIILLFVPSILLTSNAQSDRTSSINTLQYQNPDFAIKLDYPANWFKQEFNTHVDFISPQENALDEYPEWLTIGVVPSNNKPFNNFINSISKERSHLENFKFVESHQNIDGTIRHVVYTFDDPSLGNTKAMDILTSNSGRFYLIQYFAEPSKYNIYLPIIENILLSIQWLS